MLPDWTPTRSGAKLAVDVVVNCFNYGRFLGASIESALAQTHPLVRVIVVDDGSTDDSRAVIARYEDRVTAVYKDNGGQASALNAGFARVGGDLVIFLDADDMLMSDIAARVAVAAIAEPQAAKIQWPMELIDSQGKSSGREIPPNHIPLPRGDMRRAELSFPFDITWMAMSGNAFSVEHLGAIMPMPEAEYRIGADSYLQHLTALLGPVVSMDHAGSYRRVHAANAFQHQDGAPLDLERVGATIRKARVTAGHLEGLAIRLGLPRPRGGSVSDIAHQLIAARLADATAIERGRTRLAIAGVTAALRRYDVRPPMRAVFCAWFLAMALAPRSFAACLAEWFVYPERRRAVNRLLRPLHRGSW
ncbi:MAG TPA: glycosyltransferase family A protein [Solirubrobacteraceae bacterium]|nr:glycosyltransferase family A protein [Solirubrobacteraceae bacterium]